MGVSMTFVFAAMIEFTIAHNRQRQATKTGSKPDGHTDDHELTEEQKTQCRMLEHIFAEAEQSIIVRDKLLSTDVTSY